jgi:hypothetical protein
MTGSQGFAVVHVLRGTLFPGHPVSVLGFFSGAADVLVRLSTGENNLTLSKAGERPTVFSRQVVLCYERGEIFDDINNL